MPLTKLVLSNLKSRKVRTALTVAAVALALSLVVAVTSGYKSADAAIYEYLVTYMGSTDAQIGNKGDYHDGVKEDVLNLVRQDPQVAGAVGRLETDTGLVDKGGKPIPSRAAQLIGVDRPGDSDIVRTQVDEGEWFNVSRGDVAVIDQQAAELMKVKVGDTFLLPGPNGKRKLTVVGLCHKPAILADHASWIYLPLRTCQEVTNQQGKVSRILIQFKLGTDAQAFAQRWNEKLKAINPDLKLKLAGDVRKEMDRNLQGVNLLTYLGSTISIIVAAFIIFTTLSMGVTERQRTLAMLRAIGAYRFQVARLVVIEGVWLAIVGAILGTPLGLLWTWILATWKHDFFSAGLVIDWLGIILGIVFSGLAAVVAGILPAWLASRVSPLEALSPHAKMTSLKGPVICAAIGLFLVAIDTMSIHMPWTSRGAKFYIHIFLGLPTLMLGFFLLAPMAVWLVERLLATLAARVWGLQPHLVRHQLSGGIWRAAGTGAALMVGLALLIVMQTFGQSMLAGWRLPDRFPDIFIWTTNTGLVESEWKKLDQIEGIKRGEVLPIAIATPGLPEGWMGIVGAAVMPDATMYFGVDPNLALDMMELEFKQGNPKDAAAALKKGDHIIITEEFHVLKGLNVGDKMGLMTRLGRKEFTICGVVWSPGLDVMVTMFDVGRMFEERTAASVFGSVEDAQKYFGKDKIYLFAANLELGVDKTVLLKKVKEQLGERGWKAGDVRKIKYEIIKGFNRMLMLLSTIAFASLAVAALGVTNTLMASVRSRQWQFGVLRSIGVTQGQLLRLVLAEALLLGLVGCVLGLAAGFLMSFNAMGLSRFMLGYVTELTPPWGFISTAVGIVMAVALLASLWPAAHVARAQPLSLLQSGRAAI
jgi:putative ABC transport system permease protein